jgi:hypothetical protein
MGLYFKEREIQQDIKRGGGGLGEWNEGRNDKDNEEDDDNKLLEADDESSLN